MEYILLLDAYSNQKVAVLSDGRVLSENTSNLPHSDTFLELIDKTLKEAKISINDVSKIALNIGPGSFTGIRVALSIAKGLGYNSDISYLTYSSFDLVESDDNKVVLINGFSNFVYVKDNEKMDCVIYESLLRNKKYVTNSSLVFEKAKKINLNIELKDEKKTEELFKTISGNELKMNEINPLYLRKSQAEIQREQRAK